MDDILLSMKDLIQQRLSDKHIQIQALKWEQNRNGNNNDLFNSCQQKIEQQHRKNKSLKTSLI